MMKFFSFLIGIGILLSIGWFFWFLPETPWLHEEYVVWDVIIADELANLDKEKQLQPLVSAQPPLSEKEDSWVETVPQKKTPKTTKKDTLRQDEIDLLAALDTPISVRTAIELWDEYAASFQYNLARIEYLKALKETPNDIELTHKLARTYFALKRFQNLVDLYKNKPKKFDDDLRTKYILSLFYTTNFKSEQSIETLKLNIQNKWLSPHEEFYYATAAHCAIDFHECKKRFQDFLASTEYTLPQLKKISNAIALYEASQMWGLYFKDMVLIREFFHEKLYTLSTHLSIFMLKVQKDYKPLLLIAGKWYYEINDLTNARRFFEHYYRLEPKNIEVSYILGTIFFQMQDYQMSSLYFNNILRYTETPGIDIRRKLAYNYYKTQNTGAMLGMFENILKDPHATINDFSLAIYYSILEGKPTQAAQWANDGLKKFDGLNGSEMFYGYLGWIAREKKDYKKAKQYLQKGLDISKQNPLITLNLWYLEQSEKRYQLALAYFKKTISLNGEGEFWELARQEANRLEKAMEQQKGNK